MPLSFCSLGPKFLLKVIFQNSGSQPVLQSRLVFSYDPGLYSMGFDSSSKQSINIPLLLPGPKIIVETHVLSVDVQGRSGQILCLLYPSDSGSASQNASLSVSPLLTASVKMPVAEPML